MCELQRSSANPVSRQRSLYNYLMKTGKWEPTYAETAHIRLRKTSFNNYVQMHGEAIEGNWMVGMLSNSMSGNFSHHELDVAKRRLQSMVVGFTDQMVESACRIANFWQFKLTADDKERTREIFMKKVNSGPSDTEIISSKTIDTLTSEKGPLHLDMLLYKYAKTVLWKQQAMWD